MSGPGTLSNEFSFRNLPVPDPAEYEIRIKVKYAAINIDDIRIAEGNFVPSTLKDKPTEINPFIPGHDFAGIVDAIGLGVTRLKVGDRVYGQTVLGRNGSWGEYCIAAEKSTGIVPDGWTMQQAVSYVMGSQVGKAAIDTLGDFKGKTIVIIGVSGSIGNITLQYLVQNGAKVWGVCSGKNTDKVKQLGAEKVLDYTKGSFDAQILHDKANVDFVIDFVGGEENRKSAFKVLKKSGRFVTAVGPVNFTSNLVVKARDMIRIGMYLIYHILKSNFANQNTPLR